MKKIIFPVTGGVILVLLSAVFLLVNKDGTETSKIENEYTKLQEKLEKKQGREGIEVVDFADDYARLFTRISEGNVADAKDYAQLVRTITGNTIEFEDEEVFSLAGEIAQFYKKMADGFDDFGVQQIKIVKDNSGKCSLVIDYIGDQVDIRGYRIRKMGKDENEKVYSGEQEVEADGSSGENRIEIMFFGRASRVLCNMYPPGTVHKLMTVPTEFKADFNIRIVPVPGLDGFAVYIGSDEPIDIDEKDYTEINRITGSIDIWIF